MSFSRQPYRQAGNQGSLVFLCFVVLLACGCNTYRHPPYPASWEVEIVKLGEPQAAFLASDGSIAVRYHIKRERESEDSGYHWLLIEPEAAAEVLKPISELDFERHEVYRRRFAQVRSATSDPKFGHPVNARVLPPILEPGFAGAEIPDAVAKPAEELLIVINEEDRVSLRNADRAALETRLIDLWPTFEEDQTEKGAARERRYRAVIAPINTAGDVIAMPARLLFVAWLATKWDRSGK